MTESPDNPLPAENQKSKLRAQLTVPRPNGDDNPNNVYVREDVDARVRALTHLLPNHQLEPTDVFIVGYMKSGTTWFRTLVASLVYGLDSPHLPFSVVWELIPNHGPTKPYYKRYHDPMYFKVHDFPRPQYKRVVFLVRDGRDVVVSLAHHLRNVYKREIDLLQLAKGHYRRFSGKYAWGDHAEAWLSNPHGAEMITIRFEDLKADPMPELRRFCRFAGIERDDDALARAVAFASFDAMRDRERRLGMDYRTWPRDRPFVRRGQAGSHKDEMPPDVLEVFLREAGDTLRRLGYV
jgi:hypothetical protein